MSTSNINMSTQCCVDAPNEWKISVYIDENWVLKQKNDDWCEYVIYCSAE